MTKFVAILLYIWLGGDKQMTLKLEQLPHPSMQLCMSNGQARVEELEKNPNFVGGLFSRCIELPVLEA